MLIETVHAEPSPFKIVFVLHIVVFNSCDYGFLDVIGNFEKPKFWAAYYAYIIC